MNINPIYLQDLSNMFVRIDPKEIELSDLKSGYIMKTNYSETNNHWMFLEKLYLNKIFGFSFYNTSGLVHPDKESIYGASLISIDDYTKTWPNHKRWFDLNVIDIWIPDFDVSCIVSSESLKDIFGKYNIAEL